MAPGENIAGLPAWGLRMEVCQSDCQSTIGQYAAFFKNWPPGLGFYDVPSPTAASVHPPPQASARFQSHPCLHRYPASRTPIQASLELLRDCSQLFKKVFFRFMLLLILLVHSRLIWEEAFNSLWQFAMLLNRKSFNNNNKNTMQI